MRTIEGGFNQQELYVSPKYFIWGEASPGDLDIETASIVVGTKFQLTTGSDPGAVFGIRWFRTDGSPGVSAVALWDETDLLASIDVTGETTDGWQQQYFEFEVFATAGTIYTASALYTAGEFRSTPELLLSSIFTEDGYIEVVDNTTSANGVYTYSSTMVRPTTSAAGTCFYVDIIYTDQL